MKFFLAKVYTRHVWALNCVAQSLEMVGRGAERLDLTDRRSLIYTAWETPLNLLEDVAKKGQAAQRTRRDRTGEKGLEDQSKCCPKTKQGARTLWEGKRLSGGKGRAAQELKRWATWCQKSGMSFKTQSRAGSDYHRFVLNMHRQDEAVRHTEKQDTWWSCIAGLSSENDAHPKSMHLSPTHLACLIGMLHHSNDDFVHMECPPHPEQYRIFLRAAFDNLDLVNGDLEWMLSCLISILTSWQPHSICLASHGSGLFCRKIFSQKQVWWFLTQSNAWQMH